MFFRKSREIKYLENEVANWKQATKDAIEQAGRVVEYVDATPTDCCRGAHCAGCANAELICIRTDFGPRYVPPDARYRYTYVCGLGLCKNFKQRQPDPEDVKKETIT